MKTLDLKRKADSNGANGLSTVQAETAKGGALQPSKAFDDKKPEEPNKKIDPAAIQTDGGEKPQQAAKADEKKDGSRKVEDVKPILNLEGTLKLVEELHRRKIHRDNLLNTIKTLEEFEVLVQEESEEMESSNFQGCKLTIEDDNRNAFSTKNPALIKAVAEYLNEKCVAKLAEIEADIVIPV